MPPPSLRSFARFADRESLRTDLGTACRSAVALLIVLTLSAAGWMPLEVGFVSIAAHSLSMVDIRGPYPLRLAFLLTMIVVLAGSALVGSLAAVHPVAAVAAVGLVAVNAGLWRHLTPEYGPALAVPGGLMFLMALGHPGHGTHALSVVAGAMLAVVIQVALWPIRPQQPLRQAVGRCWESAARLVDAISGPGTVDVSGVDDPAADPQQAYTAAEIELRAALDAAYVTLAAVDKTRPLVPQLDSMAHAAGRLGMRAAALKSAADALAGRADFARLAVAFAATFKALGGTAHAFALAVVSRQPSHLAACEVAVRRAASLLAALKDNIQAGADPSKPVMLTPAEYQAAHVIDLLDAELSDSVLALVGVTDRVGERAVFPLELFDVNTWRLRPLAAALNLRAKPDPALIRFTLRLAVLLMIGVAAVEYLKLPHGYWLPFTMLVVSQTDYGATRLRAAERFGGTLLGGLIASGLLFLSPPPAIAVGGVVACGFGFGFLLKRNYGVAVVFVTVMVVLLLEGFNGHPPLRTMLETTVERLGATAVGGATALAAAMLFWPAWERDRNPPVLAEALRAAGKYAKVAAARLAAGGAYTPADIEAKRVAERANAAALASLARMYADPANRRAGVERAAALANGNQRLVRALNLLLLRSGKVNDPADAAAVVRWADRAAAELNALADAAAGAASTAGVFVPAARDPEAAACGPAAASLLAKAQTELDGMVQTLRRPVANGASNV